MPKKYYLILNWKMNLGILESRDLARNIKENLNRIKAADFLEFIICPSYPAIALVREALGYSQIKLGAQDVFWTDKGAYTGEVSVLSLKEMGVKYVLVGHSERRQYLNESNEMINKKTTEILKNGLVPIICVGETFEERREGMKDAIVTNQLAAALTNVNLNPDQQIIIAYEPVWVIGSGQAVLPEEAEHTNLVIRQALFDIAYENNWPSGNELIEKNIKLIYGGSVNEDNVKEFLSKKAIDGLLIGTASLDPEKIFNLIKTIK